jgi:hypothetical protein
VAILIALAAAGWFVSWAPVWITTIVLLAVLVFFSRDPERFTTAPPDAILSPARWTGDRCSRNGRLGRRCERETMHLTCARLRDASFEE